MLPKLRKRIDKYSKNFNNEIGYTKRMTQNWRIQLNFKNTLEEINVSLGYTEESFSDLENRIMKSPNNSEKKNN